MENVDESEGGLSGSAPHAAVVLNETTSASRGHNQFVKCLLTKLPVMSYPSGGGVHKLDYDSVCMFILNSGNPARLLENSCSRNIRPT